MKTSRLIRTNFLDQAREAEKSQALFAREMNTRVAAVRRYIQGNILRGHVLEIHDSVDVVLPPGTHPVHEIVIRGILLDTKRKVSQC